MHSRANIIGWIAILINAGAQLLLAPIVRLKMGATGLGVWHLVFQTYIYLQLIDFGWSNGIVREIACTNLNTSKQPFINLMNSAKQLLSITGVVFSIVGICAAVLVPKLIKIPHAFHRDFALAVILLSVWGMFRYRYSLSFLALRGFNRLTAFNSLELIQGAGRPILGALLVFLHMHILGIAAGYAAAEAATRWIAFRLFPIDTSRKTSNCYIFFRMLKFGGVTGIISISTLVTFYSSSFIIGWKLGVLQIAIYQSSIALPLLLMRMAIIPFTNRLPSLISEFQNFKNTNTLTSAFRLHLLVLLCCSLLMLGTCMINKLFVTIWVGRDLFAGFYFTILFSFFLLLSIARHNGFMVWQARGYLKSMMIAHLIDIPTNIFLSIILLQYFGLKGIALAFIIAAIPSLIVSQLAFYSGNKFKIYSS